jgi:hypothetical protein
MLPSEAMKAMQETKGSSSTGLRLELGFALGLRFASTGRRESIEERIYPETYRKRF